MKSMTGYGSAQQSSDIGNVTVEIRSVNSRYLDLQFRMPDELRMAEMPMRERIAQAVTRGKIEVRASFNRVSKDLSAKLTPALLEQVQATYLHVKEKLPAVGTPTFADVLQWTDLDRSAADPLQWVPLCVQATDAALVQLVQTRTREGARLAEIILEQALQATTIVQKLKLELPTLIKQQSDRVAMRMREAFEQASPEGLAHIRPQEISERLAAEASIFSLRADVAEELDRLSLHLNELQDIVARHRQGTKTADLKDKQPNTKGVGKRLDFLFQEMNREANTLGSKAVDIQLTRAAIDLKLLIEQMREQIQNIE